jgi:hypothetical protein
MQPKSQGKPVNAFTPEQITYYTLEFMEHAKAREMYVSAIQAAQRELRFLRDMHVDTLRKVLSILPVFKDIDIPSNQQIALVLASNQLARAIYDYMVGRIHEEIGAND